MLKRTKLLLTTLCAIVACSFAAGSASANRSIEIRGGPGVQAEGRIQFIGTEGSPSVEITCDITILRTITALVPKIRGTEFGKVTGILIDRGETARTPHCRNGGFIRLVHDITPLINPRTPCTHTEDRRGILRWDCSRAPAGLWKLIYDSFQGTLPGIEGANIHIQGYQTNARFLEIFGGIIECLYEGNAFALIVVSAGVSRSARAVRELTGLTRISGSGLCPARGAFEGSFNVTPNLTITLK